MDACVSVPMRMVLAKTDVKSLPTVSCLRVHATRSSYQVDIILAACRKERWYSTLSYRSDSLAILIKNAAVHHQPTLAGGARLHF